MMKQLFLPIVLVSFLGQASSSANGPAAPTDFAKSVLRCELVVHGIIHSITATTAPEHGKLYPATAIDLDVRDVLKGGYSEHSIRAILLGTADAGAEGVTYDYAVGDDVILCLRYDPETQGGVFRFWTDRQSFVNHGGGSSPGLMDTWLRV